MRPRSDSSSFSERWWIPLFLAALCTLLPSRAPAQEQGGRLAPGAGPGCEGAGGPQPGEEAAAARAAKFLLGGAAGLGLHEGGHLVFDGLFGVQPVLKRVQLAGIPFVAITHYELVPRRQEFVISSAGFWMQHLSSELILSRHPRLQDEASPFLKGILAFNVIASVAYGSVAMARAGPFERDTRGMASSLRVPEPWIGALVLAPAALDGWRFFHPEARWAKWVSRGVKVGAVLLVVR